MYYTVGMAATGNTVHPSKNTGMLLVYRAAYIGILGRRLVYYIDCILARSFLGPAWYLVDSQYSVYCKATTQKEATRNKFSPYI